MLNTVVQQARTTLVLSDGSIIYQITANVTDKGELPHANLFVFEIKDALDATRDTFTRVGNPYDLDNLYTTRAGAISNGQTYYLTSSMVKRYTDLSIATPAVDAIRSRIDNAVNAWYTYKTAFEGTEVYNHPTAEATYEQQLQDAYAEAKADRIAAEAAVSTADVDLILAQDAAADAVDLSNKYKEALDFTNQSYLIYWGTYYNAAVAFLASMEARFTAFKTEYQTLSGHTYKSSGTEGDVVYDPWLGQLQLMEQAIETFKTASGNGTSLNTSFGTYHLLVGGYYTAQQGVIASANVEAAAAVTAKKEAEASLAAAQTAEDAALAAVLAVCPDFDPSTV